MIAEIKANEQAQQKGGFQTVGDFLFEKKSQRDHRARQEDDHVRNRHLSRQQMVDEFNAIWDTQAKHYPDILTGRLRIGSHGDGISPRSSLAKSDRGRLGESDLEAFGLFGMIFFQRKVYWPKSVVGLCELEPKEKRCPRADRRVEQFRIWQEINNLRYSNPETEEEEQLSDGQRQMLFEYLATRDKATFDQLRKKLGFDNSVRFNLERGKRPSIKGMVTDHKIAKLIGKSWHGWDELEKNSIVRTLIHVEDEHRLLRKLTDEFSFSAEQAEALMDLDFPPGYSNLSLKAIDRLLPFLEKGLVYQSTSDPEASALHAAGYLRRDELRRRLFDKLPDLARIPATDCRLGDIPNPVVKRALVELRKVVNAIIREHGRPDAVHVEMTRSLQMGKERRVQMNRMMREREAQRDRAASEVRNLGQAVRREKINQFLIWEQQAGECIYCGKTISLAQLFGDAIDVDHILPKSRSLDDSQMNKVVCHTKCNHDKGQQTPYEWLAASVPDRYAEVCQRVGSLMRRGLFPYPKYKRFLQKELKLDNFINRQLTDTSYITRATVEYLKLLFENEHAVLGLKGQLTAELRWHWGLSTVLEELPDSPAWQQANLLRPGEKNRADHRHHAVDALVIALTNRSRLRLLADIVRRGGAATHGEVLIDPWPEFRADVSQHISRIKVSHRVNRKIQGALHEETLYGPTPDPELWVVRKPISELSASEIPRIRDEGIKRIVVQALKKNGLEYGRGKKPNAKKMKEALATLAMPSGVPIKRVRLFKPERTIAPLRSANARARAFVKPGNTHHVCIFEYEERGKRKREPVFVTMLEAIQRQKDHQPLIQRTHPHRPQAKFVMSLASGELVLVRIDGQDRLLVFKTAVATTGQLRFVDHLDARRSADQKLISFSANTLCESQARKVTVDPLGRIRWAND